MCILQSTMKYAEQQTKLFGASGFVGENGMGLDVIGMG
jgi:hypothetical protein